MADKRRIAWRDAIFFGFEDSFQMSHGRGDVHMQDLADGAPSFQASENSALSDVY